MSDRYVVRKPFKYNGVILQRGDAWQPVGSRFDPLIAASRYVERIDEIEPKKEQTHAKNRTRRADPD